MATFMVASNVRFLDDTSLGHVPMNQEAVTGGNGSLEPQESVFYLSRLNDPTTYFFTWVCKRYRLTVKSEPHNCPICLETGENNIQLSCGACAGVGREHKARATCGGESRLIRFGRSALLAHRTLFPPPNPNQATPSAGSA